MKINQRPGRAAFTLIELMAVITIIVILAALVVGGLAFVTDKQAKSKATVQISLMSKALEEYKNDMGQYPPTTNSADGKNNTEVSIYQALFYEGYDYSKNPTQSPSVPPKATRMYLPELDPITSKQGWVDPVTGASSLPPATAKVKDPWGNEYRYRSAKDKDGNANADTQNPDFDLWSSGKDGKSTPKPADKENRDDIRP